MDDYQPDPGIHLGRVEDVLGIPIVESRWLPPDHVYIMSPDAGPVIFFPCPEEPRRPWYRRALRWLARVVLRRPQEPPRATFEWPDR